MDELYRWRRWTAAPFVVLLYALGDSWVHNRIWLASGLLALVVLVWLPIGWRWARRANEAQAAFGEGLNGK
ncbi:MAG TPA: hypothetical protein VFR99_03515 [Marmoricola sp.]|nr:hypothetical protein [Marmoricola sp.]